MERNTQEVAGSNPAERTPNNNLVYDRWPLAKQDVYSKIAIMKKVIVFYGGEHSAMFPLSNQVIIPEWAKYFVIFEFHLE